MIGIIMFFTALALLLLGIPVAFVFGTTAIIFTIISLDFGFEIFNFLPFRIYGIMQNFTLISIPLFILMGTILEKSGLAENLLKTMGSLLGRFRGGLAISVVLVGLILATATGIVGASVVMMGIISLPVLLKYRYDKALASGTILASGTLGQIVPPSIVLIILADVMNLSIGDLFSASLIPSMILVALYILYIVFKTSSSSNPPEKVDLGDITTFELLKSLLPPLFLMVAVLGSIFAGIASPTESASIGVLGAVLLTILNRKFSIKLMKEASDETLKITGMVFMILFGATAFSLVFNEWGGTDLLLKIFTEEIGDKNLFVAISMGIIFLLGFFIDFIEIAFVVVPILEPIVVEFGIDPLWFAILIAINLQTSFLTPPFGFALFFLKGAVGNLVDTLSLYRGVIPFIIIQLIVLGIVFLFPGIL
ncbi:MAG TPA: TRAP transporter large permease subunit [Campylobacterales bacterium]|nr:TRAP transporter large permease subunit [Campylobacterales bacterium]HIO70313.1 TRAP transporter large permease subunit [Campylobacterales bacterium]